MDLDVEDHRRSEEPKAYHRGHPTASARALVLGLAWSLFPDLFVVGGFGYEVESTRRARVPF